MANKVSIAQTRDRALERLKQTTGRISDQLGTSPPIMPEFDRDRDYLQAQELTALADWAEGVAQALTPTPEPITEGSKHDPQTKGTRSGH